MVATLELHAAPAQAWLSVLLALSVQLVGAACPEGLCPPGTSSMCMDADSTLASCARDLCGCLASAPGSYSYAGHTAEEAHGAFLALELGDGQGAETRVQVSAGCDVHLVFVVGTKLTNLTQEMILVKKELNFTLDLQARIGMCSDSILENPAENVADAIDNYYSSDTVKYQYISEYMFDDGGAPQDLVLRHRWARPCTSGAPATPGRAYLMIWYHTYEIVYTSARDCLRIDVPGPYALYPRPLHPGVGVGGSGDGCPCSDSAACAAPIQNFSTPLWGKGYEVYTGCKRNWSSSLWEDSSSWSSSSSSSSSSSLWEDSSSSSSSSSWSWGSILGEERVGCPADLCPAGTTEAFCFTLGTPLANCSLWDCGCRARAAGTFTFQGTEADSFGVVALPLRRGQGAETRLTISRGCDVGIHLSVRQLSAGSEKNSSEDTAAHVGLCSDGLTIASEYVLEALNNSYSPGYTTGTAQAPSGTYLFKDNGPAHQVVLRHRWSRPCTGGVEGSLFAYLVVSYYSFLAYNSTGGCLRLDISNPFELYARPSTGAGEICNCQGAQACAAPTRNYSVPERGLGYELYEGCENKWQEALGNATTTTAPSPSPGTATTTTAPGNGSTSAAPSGEPPALSSAPLRAAGTCWTWLLVLALSSWMP